MIYPNKNIIIDYIEKGNGIIMVCGSVGLKEGVMKVLEKIFNERNMDNYVHKLIEDDRLLLEVWG